MPVEITMPQLSDTMTEGTVVKWLKAEGDKIKESEIIAEIETDKANMEFESEAAGTVAALVVPEGGKASVGDVIAVIATAKENAAEIKKQYAGKKSGGGAAAAPTGKPAETVPPPAGKKAVEEPAPKGGSGEGRKAPTTFASASTDEMREEDEVGHGATRSAVAERPREAARGGNGAGGRIVASPLARRIAEDRGVDLSQIEGSGPNGRIVKEDVLAFAEGRTGGAQAPSGAGKQTAAPAAPLPQRVGTGQKQVVALTKMRATIGQRLQQAKQQIPHIYVSIDIDMDPISALRERVNKQLEKQDIRISIADFIAKAVATALVRHPEMNAHFDAANSQIIRDGDVHLGIAVALPEGLMVPVLRNVDQMGLQEIRQRSADLFDRTRAQKLKRDELSGATFTITNLGQWGVKQFDAVINPPEVGILAVSAAEKRPVVKNGQVVPGTVMTVTLSADHRAIDGAVAAEFLRTLKGLLEEPGLMLV